MLCLSPSRYPPDTEEKQKNLGAWFGKHGPQPTAAELPGYVKAVQEKNPSVKSWALLGVSFPPPRAHARVQ